MEVIVNAFLLLLERSAESVNEPTWFRWKK